MFNRKLKERVARLERLVDGQKAGTETIWAGGFLLDLRAIPAEAGLQNKVEALANKFGLEFEKQPDVLGTWRAVEKQPAKRSKRG